MLCMVGLGTQLVLCAIKAMLEDNCDDVSEVCRVLKQKSLMCDYVRVINFRIITEIPRIFILLRS